MSISDSSFTNPDSLRARYINPRNVLLNLDEQASGESVASAGDGAALIVNQSSSVQTPTFNPRPIGSNCPAVGQFVLARNNHGNPFVKFAEHLFAGSDYLYNPITKTFHKVAYAAIVSNQECARVRTFDGAEKIVSLSHPVIRNFADRNGITVAEIIGNPDASAGAVSVIDFAANETEIETIITIGRRDVVHISLEDGYIFACGSNPLKLILGHNKANDRPDDEPINQV